MANTIRIKRRASGGSAGAPTALLNAELAYNEADNILYYGYGDDGSGNATSIVSIGGSGNYVTVGTDQTVSGVKTFDGTLNVTGAFQLNGVAVTVTAAEINHLSGVTSNVQTQIDGATGDIANLQAATGIADGDTNMGTYGGTGSILSDNGTVKAALEELEAAIVDGSGTTTTDSGTASYDNGNINILGGTGLTTSGDSAQTVTVTLDDTAVTAASYGAAGSVPTYTVDQQGRLTAAADVLIDIAHTQVNDFDAGVQTNTLDSLAAPVADVSLNGNKITGLGDPVSAQDAATKAYVDAAANGLDVKESVRVTTTADITLENLQTVDGVSLAAGDRVLVKNQTTASENGIYDVVDGGAWTRSADADNAPGAEVTPGMFTFVEEGSTYADAGFVLQTSGTIVLDTTDLSFVQFSGAGQVIAGGGLTKTGNQLDVVTADTGRIVVNADSIDLATHGTAGTYNGLTVDAYGRVSSFVQGTTLADYSIVDAQPLDATLTALAGLTTAADQMVYSTGSDAFAMTSLTTYARSLLDDADATAARSTLGLGSMAVQDANNVAITGGTLDNIVIDGGTF